MIFFGEVMSTLKRKIIILVVICLIVLVGALIFDRFLGKDYLTQIKYDEVIKKVQNKDSFVLLISQTTCSHCKNFKPKLSEVAKEYKLNIYYIEVDLLSEDEYNSFKKYFNFEGTPQTVFVIDGYEKTAANRIVGDTSTEKIISKLKSNGFID